MGQDSSKEQKLPAELVQLFHAGVHEITLDRIKSFLNAAPENRQILSKAKDPKNGMNLLMIICAVSSKDYNAMSPQDRSRFDQKRLDIIKFLLQDKPEMFDVNEAAQPPSSSENNNDDANTSCPISPSVSSALGTDFTALGFACACKTESSDIIEALLLEGANPAQPSPSRGITPLMIASVAQFPKAIGELLATNKATPSATCKKLKNTALHFVSHFTVTFKKNRSATNNVIPDHSDAIACAELLIAAGADTEIKNHRGYTPLVEALFAAVPEADDLLRYFIKSGCDFYAHRTIIRSILAKEHQTALVLHKDNRVLQLFDRQHERLERNLFCSILTEQPEKFLKFNKRTRLHEAVLFGSPGVLSCLLDGGATVDGLCDFVPHGASSGDDETSTKKVTPLQLACGLSSLASSQFLFNEDEQSRADDDTLAYEMSRLLLKAGAKASFFHHSPPSSSSLSQQRTLAALPPLFIAAANRVDSRALIKLIAESTETTTNIEIPSSSSSSPSNILEMAVKYNNYFVCDYLVNTLKFNLHLQSPEKYQRIQNLIHVTEANLQNALLERNSPTPSTPPKELIVRPFKPTQKTANSDKINLKYISLLLPPQTFNQEAVISPLYFNPQLLSIKIENDLANGSSKLSLQPSPNNGVVSLAPEDRAKRIVLGSSLLNTEAAKISAQKEADSVCDFPGVYDGHEEDRLRLLKQKHSVIVEPTSDECFVGKLERLENGVSQMQAAAVAAAAVATEDPEKELTEDEKTQRFEARLSSFFSKYNPSKLQPNEFQKITMIRKVMGEEKMFEMLQAKYGPEPPFHYTSPAAASNTNNNPILGVGTERKDEVLNVMFHARQNVSSSSAESPNFGKHFPFPDDLNKEFKKSNLFQFFVREFELLFDTLETNEDFKSKAFQHAYVLVLRNTLQSDYHESAEEKVNIDYNLFEIYSRMWKWYYQQYLERSADSNNNSNALLPSSSYLAPMLHNLYFARERLPSNVHIEQELLEKWRYQIKLAHEKNNENSSVATKSCLKASWHVLSSRHIANYGEHWSDSRESMFPLFFYYPCIGDPSPLANGGGTNFRQRLVTFFERYNPEKIAKIDFILQKYTGVEDDMFEMLTAKYGPEPECAVGTASVDYSWGSSRLEKRNNFASNYKGSSALAANESDFVDVERDPALFMYSASSSSSPSNAFLHRIHSLLPDTNVQQDQLRKAACTFAGDELLIHNKIEGTEEFKKKWKRRLKSILVRIPPTSFKTASVSGMKMLRRVPPSELDMEARISSFYKMHAPEKLANLDVLMKLGNLDRILNTLIQKYGPEPEFYEVPFDHPTTTTSSASTSDPRARLTRFYKKYDPAKIGMIDKILSKYSGEEDHMFEMLMAKYGPEPPAEEQKQDSITNVGSFVKLYISSSFPALPSFEERVSRLADHLPLNIRSYFGLDVQTKSKEEIIRELKSGGEQLEGLCEGSLIEFDSKAPMTSQNGGDGTQTADDMKMAFICSRFCVDEPEPRVPPTRNFLLPNVDLVCQGCSIVDVGFAVSEYLYDDLQIQINLLLKVTRNLKPIPVPGKDNNYYYPPEMIVEKNLSFLCADLGVVGDTTVANGGNDNNNNALSQEFSL